MQMVVSEQLQRSKNLYESKKSGPHEPPVSCHVEASVWRRAQTVVRKPLDGVAFWKAFKGCWRMACSDNVCCVQFTRSPMKMVVKSGAGPDSQTGSVLQRAGHCIRWQQLAICTAFSADIKLDIAFAEQICAQGPAEVTPYLQNASPSVNNLRGCVDPVQVQTQQTRSSPEWYGSFLNGHAHSMPQ
jgi:hypothetical protein